MICEYTIKELVKDAKRADLKLVTADSPVCFYCARKLHPDDGFEDAQKCKECIHNKHDYNYASECLCYDNFLGIQCVTWKED